MIRVGISRRRLNWRVSKNRDVTFKGHEEVVEHLLGAGANINAQGGEYGNALQAASFKGYEEVVEPLLSAGVML